MKLRDFIKNSKTYPYYWRTIGSNYNYKGGKPVVVEEVDTVSYFRDGQWRELRFSKGLTWYNKRHPLSPIRLFLFLVNRYVSKFFQKRKNPIYIYDQTSTR